MKINKKAVEGKWVKYGGKKSKMELLVRPFPFSDAVYERERANAFANSLWHQFNFVVQDWKGLMGEDDKPMECNEENKQFMFDYFEELREFALVEANKMSKKLNDSLKN